MSGVDRVSWKPIQQQPSYCIYGISAAIGGAGLKNGYATQEALHRWLKLPFEGYQFYLSVGPIVGGSATGPIVNGRVGARWSAFAESDRDIPLGYIVREKMEEKIKDLNWLLKFA